MLRALFPQAVFIPNQRSIHAPVKFHSRTLHSEVSALIDSGATENFISPKVIDRFNVPTYLLPKPRVIRNVDGTKNSIGSVISAANLDISYRNKKDTHTFYIIDLGEDHMLLGMPFLAATNPEINWTEGTFQGKVVAASMDAHKWIPMKDSKIHRTFSKTCHTSTLDGQFPFINTDPDDYTFIGRTTTATKIAADAANKAEQTWQEQVPIEYHQYGKVFSNKAAQRFPDSQPWDHAIDLVPDAPTLLNCKVYPLAEGQQDLLDTFLDEHLKKGYI